MSFREDDGTNRLAAVVAVIAGLVLAVLSATVAYLFGDVVGVNDSDKVVMGALGVVVIAGKAVMPFAIYAAWRQGRPIMFSGAALALLVFVAYSVTSSFGYAAALRAPAEREAEAVAFKQALLEAMPQTLPAAAIKPLIAAERNEARKARLRSDLAIAEEAERLSSQVISDPAAESHAGIAHLAEMLSIPVAHVRSGWLAVLASVMEVGELMLFMSASALWWGKGGRERRKRAKAEDQPKVSAVPAPPAADRMTTTAWIGQHLRSGDDVNPTDAYALYKAEWASRRRKPLAKARFLRLLDKTAKSVQAQRTAIAGRLYYRLAA